MQQPDQWVPVDKAMKLLGKGERSIQRLVQQGVLEQRRAGVNGHSERLYSTRDLVRIKEQGISSTAALAPVPRPLASVQALPAPEPEPKPAANALWLSIEQAAEVSGFAPSFLRGLIDTEAIAAVKGGPHGAWRIRRASLEEYAG